MEKEPTPGEYTPEEAERRAKETAHRLLNTPPKPRTKSPKRTPEPNGPKSKTAKE
jgi:hypothetical protein